MITTNIKIWGLKEAANWEQAEGNSLNFENRQAAFTFGRQLSAFHGKPVRLDFSDFSGKCNGNGCYIHQTEKDVSNIIFNAPVTQLEAI